MNAHPITLSIVIPVYNCVDYLIKGLDNLQPFWNSDLAFEVIYVNDGSTDNSLAVLNEIASQYDNVTVIDQPNMGSSGARNTALEVVRGEYIFFLDSDDVIDAKIIFKALEKCEELDLDVYSFRFQKVSSDGQVIQIMNVMQVYDQLLTGEEVLMSGYQPSSICVFVFRRAFLEQHKLRFALKLAQMDVEFTSRMFIHAKRCYFTKDIGYFYMIRSGSITQATSREKVEKYISDALIVANNINKTIKNDMNSKLRTAIQRNANNVMWNVLWRFLTNKSETSIEFRRECIAKAYELNLLPIKGDLSTYKQHIVNRFLFNAPMMKILKIY